MVSEHSVVFSEDFVLFHSDLGLLLSKCLLSDQGRTVTFCLDPIDVLWSFYSSLYQASCTCVVLIIVLETVNLSLFSYSRVYLVKISFIGFKILFK